MRLKTTIFLYFAMLVVAMVAARPHSAGLLIFWAFPLGLAVYLEKIPYGANVLPPIIAYGAYVVFLVLFIRLRNRPLWFYLAVALFAVLLGFNVTSCRHQYTDWRASQP